MKTKIKGFLLIGICVLGLFSLQACFDDDDYYDLYRVSMATVVPNTTHAKGIGYYLQLDSGTGLDPTQSDETWYAPKAGQRVFAWYTVLADNNYHSPNKGYDIRLLRLRTILTKGTIRLSATNADSIGNDPVRILDIWAGGDFMNIRFSYYAGGSTVHFINLVENTLASSASDGKVHLEFRHNGHNGPQYYREVGFVCFNIKPYRVAGKDLVEFVIQAKEFTGTRTYTVTYNYGSKSVTAIDVKTDATSFSTEGYQ